MSILFTPAEIGSLILRNRFIRSATCEGSADRTGQASDRQIQTAAELIQGGVGLIVLGAISVQDSGRFLPTQNSIATDEFIPGLRRLTEQAHETGGKIAAQLFHAGKFAAALQKRIEGRAIAPSVVADASFTGVYESMNEQDIAETIEAFGRAAGRARESGFDAVQIHAAHGYLPSQFLSPCTNHRTDMWGGPLENRLRFLRGVYNAVRKAVGDGYPVFFKLGVQDGITGGLELQEGVAAAQAADDWGVAAIEVSQGLSGQGLDNGPSRSGIDRLDREAYFREWCKPIRARVKAPLIMVGGLRTFGLMEEIVANGEADFVALCRPLIKEPGLIRDWERGEQRASSCVSCNACLKALVRGKPFGCYHRP